MPVRLETMLRNYRLSHRRIRIESLKERRYP